MKYLLFLLTQINQDRYFDVGLWTIPLLSHLVRYKEREIFIVSADTDQSRHIN